ncbi:MAG: phosphoglucosamine mutase [Xanthomonadales bacterium]|nr:phosphoglucosamine mutase [Xanthomonadales bacterium]
MSSKRYFGTDGIRGRVGEGAITAEFALRLGRAMGTVLQRRGAPLAVIGKDTRISGYMFESALEAGLAAGGADVRLLGPMPTPAVAYLARTLRAGAGIVISASHNPHFDNGFKFFSGAGEKLPDDVELEIEAELDKPFETVASEKLGKAQRVDDAAGRYIEYCKRTVPHLTSLSGLTVVVDCANGATYHVAPDVFTELGAKVITTGAEPDGLNINLECGALHPGNLQRVVMETGADVGIALDGDGDRVMMVDENGTLVDGDGILYVMANERHANGRLGGGVVGTLMTNIGLELALKDLGIPFDRSNVGDRYVHQCLVNHGWVLGGETSGHILCMDKSTTGDGIVSALEILSVMQSLDQPLSALAGGMTRFPQQMINVPVAQKVDLDSSDKVEAAVRDVESELAGQGRVILRPSGTEPVVRVTVEGREADQVDRLARQLAEVVETEFA